MFRKSKAAIVDLRKRRKQCETEELQHIQQILDEQAPPRGANPIAIRDEQETNDKAISGGKKAFNLLSRTFAELPLSKRTRNALGRHHFQVLSDVQSAVLPHVLVGRDALVIAKTGSGKTICFLLPIIERLYRLGWSKADGLGALVISPTRELALQTFQCLRHIGEAHDFSAGLLIGGKASQVHEERRHVGHMNILICTPGRLLQHLDESPHFHCDGLQFLILDEADQLLERGFSKQIDAILAHLPHPDIHQGPSDRRQTMLFSATMGDSVHQLARLSVGSKEPIEILKVHASAPSATPARLAQSYVICHAAEKISLLWNFVKAHLRRKILVFFATQRQVRFIYEGFRQMRPGLPVLLLHGRQNQRTRLKVYEEFSAAPFSLLLATDVAARGLDFKKVDWVIQVDCPESADAYLHRVGRTARYENMGRAVLFLLPEEADYFVPIIHQHAIPIEVTKLDTHSQFTLQVDVALQALLVQQPELKFSAQKAIRSYVRSLLLAAKSKNRPAFNEEAFGLGAFAHSYGLLQAPRINANKVKFIDKNAIQIAKKLQETTKQLGMGLDSHGGESMNEELNEEEWHHKAVNATTKNTKSQIAKSQHDKLVHKKNSNVLNEDWAKMRQEFEPNEFEIAANEVEDEDWLVPKDKQKGKPLKSNNEQDKKSLFGNNVDQGLCTDEEELATNSSHSSSIPSNHSVYVKKIKPYKYGADVIIFKYSDDDKDEIDSSAQSTSSNPVFSSSANIQNTDQDLSKRNKKNNISYTKRLAMEIEEADDEDKAAYKQLLRQKRQKRKLLVERGAERENEFSIKREKRTIPQR